MTCAPSRSNALLGSLTSFAVFLTVLLPFYAAEAKIKGVAQEACDISEDEFKAKIVEDVLSEKTLCGEGVTPEHTGGYTCTKLSLKSCKKSRLRCVTQFICSEGAVVEPEVVLLGTPKPAEPVAVANTKAVTPQPAGQPMNEAKPAANSVAPSTAAPASPKVQPVAAAQTPQPTAQTKVVTAPPSAMTAPPAAVSAQPLPTTVPPPAFKPQASLGNGAPVAATAPPVQPGSTETKVEKLVKPVDIQQIDLDSFGQGDQVPAIPGLAALGTGFLIGMFAMILFFIAAMWRLLEKAGHRGFAALIPFYNLYKLHKIAGQPGWWVIVDFIPFVGFISACLMNKKLAEKFGSSQGVMVLMILLPPIGYAVVAFSPKYQYMGGEGVPEGLEGADPKAVAEWQEIKMVPPEDQ